MMSVVSRVQDKEETLGFAGSLGLYRLSLYSY